MNSTSEILDFTMIFNLYKGKVYNYVLKMTGDRMTSEDIVQNVFMSFWDNLQKINNRMSINFWIFRTARNEILMYYRKKKTHKDQFNVDDTDELEVSSYFDLNDLIEKNEVANLISSELKAAPEEQREVFYLKEYGGLSYGEIASVMDIDEKLVKSRLYKIRQQLIKKLSGILRQ